MICLLHSKGYRQTYKAMNVSQAEFQNMKDEIVKDIIARLMDERALSLQEAFDTVYRSRLFEKLNNPDTGLFFQSSGYVYSYLMDEINDEALERKQSEESVKTSLQRAINEMHAGEVKHNARSMFN
jgi:hypothetical protein